MKQFQIYSTTFCFLWFPTVNFDVIQNQVMSNYGVYIVQIQKSLLCYTDNEQIEISLKDASIAEMPVLQSFILNDENLT